MSALEVASFAILGAGSAGYVLCLVVLWRFRVWMGGRGAGWPRLLLSTLLVLVGLLALLYLSSLVMQMGLVPWRGVRLVVSFATGIALTAVPWVVLGALRNWWYPRLRGRSGGIP